MGMRRNCGVFDEGTKRCIACGELQEGPQCTYITWSLVQTMYYGAQLIGIPVILDEGENRVAIVSDSSAYRAHGLNFDPTRVYAHTNWLLEFLLMNRRCSLDFSTDTRYFMVNTVLFGHINPKGERYNLNTSHRSLQHAVILAAAKHYCCVAQVEIPHNLLENRL